MSIFEDLHGNRLIVYHFPRNLHRAEKLGIEQLPALIVDREVVILGDATYREILEKLKL